MDTVEVSHDTTQRGLQWAACMLLLAFGLLFAINGQYEYEKSVPCWYRNCKCTGTYHSFPTKSYPVTFSRARTRTRLQYPTVSHSSQWQA
eukprot:scaffold530951_cov28-Prasinocladus_malaysianus.AAC.1